MCTVALSPGIGCHQGRTVPMPRLLSTGALSVPAPLPAAGPTLAFLQLLLRTANTAFSGHLPLGIFDPSDELVAGQRRDVLLSIECRRVGDQRLVQVRGKLMHRPTGHSLAAHRGKVAVAGRARFTDSAVVLGPSQTCRSHSEDPMEMAN